MRALEREAVKVRNEQLTWRKYLAEAPAGPGVYIMRDAAGAALYIGKAKSLRARLRAYLGPKSQGPKTALLLRQVAEVEFFLTDNELEALILENSLIKKWRPKYNISLKDDKTYPFLRLSIQEEFPALNVVRCPADDGARYFGPYVPAGAMRSTMHFLQRYFPLRKCRRPIGSRPKRPCLNYQMQRCYAPCTGMISLQDYRELVCGVSLFLQGRGAELSRELRRQMQAASRELQFEKAARLRDQITAISSMLVRQKAHLPGKGDMDVIGSVQLGKRRGVAVLFIRKGRIVGIRTFKVKDVLEEEGEGEGLEAFLRAYYGEIEDIPQEILLPGELVGGETISAWLEGRGGKRVALRVPRSGQKRSLVALASRNALRALEKERPARPGGEPLLLELGRLVKNEGSLASLAAVDVSNFSGSDAVASFVWWEGGRFVKPRYKRFRIRRAPARDDYAMLGEVVRRLVRRIAAGEWGSPDILMLDGGRGQLSAGESALASGNWRPKILLAIAKSSERRGTDAVFAAGRVRPLQLEPGSPVFKLLQQVRDEAHRFALSYHSLLRKKRSRVSVLDAVLGLGPSRKRLLLKKFGSVTRLRRASLEELRSLSGLPAAVAGALYEHLHRP